MRLKFIVVFLISSVPVSTCLANNIASFHDFSVGDSVLYYSYKDNFTQDNIDEYVITYWRSHRIDSIYTNKDTVTYILSFAETGGKIEYKEGIPSDTLSLGEMGVESLITINGTLITPSDFFPMKNSFSENELTRWHSFGTLEYYGRERDFLKFDHLSTGPGGSYDYEYYSYLSGFGAINTMRSAGYATAEWNWTRSIHLYKYNDMVMNPDSLDSLMLYPTSSRPPVSVNNPHSINSIQALFLQPAKNHNQNCIINIFDVNGRKLITAQRSDQLKQALNKVSSGLYIIFGHLNNIPFCFRQNILK